MSKLEGIFERFNNALPELSKSEARIAQFLLLNKDRLNLLTGTMIAQSTNVSEITVSRFFRKFNLQGMNGLRLAAYKDEQNDIFSGMHARVERLDKSELGDFIRNEADALIDLISQVTSERWDRGIEMFSKADNVYITGYQSVRGVAEDFARRLSIIRHNVHFISVHDSNLSEWLPTRHTEKVDRLLVMIDVTPYAKEAEKLAHFCTEMGVQLCIVTDEMNGWAQKYTEYVFHARSKIGTILDTSGVLTSLLNIIAHAVALKDPVSSGKRLDEWPHVVSQFDIFA